MNLLGNKLKIRELASLAFLILLIIGIPLGVSLVQKQQVLKGRASTFNNAGKLGLQVVCNYPNEQEFDALVAQRPAVIKLMNDYSCASKIKQISPSTIIVGRTYDSSFDDRYIKDWLTDDNPESRVSDYLNSNGKRDAIAGNPDVDCWEGPNETAPTDSITMNRYGRFEAERVRTLAGMGRRACVGNFGVGHPTDLGWWLDFSDALRAVQDYGGYLAVHEYSAPNMRCGFEGDEGWYTGRYRKGYRNYLQPNGLEVPLIITETGMTKAICGACGCGDNPDTGWRTFTDANTFTSEMQWYNSLLEADGYVHGAAIFISGQQGWSTFDLFPEIVGPNGLLISYGGESSAPTPTTGSSCTIGNQSPSLEDACESCIKTQRPTLPNDIRNLNSGLFSGCADKAVLNYWCNGGISQEARDSCSNLKNNTCASSCGGSSPTNTPVPTNSPNPTATPLPTQGPTSVPTPTRTLTPGPTSIPTITPFPTVPLLITPTTSTTKPTTNPTPTPTPSGKSGTIPTTSPLSKALPTLRPDKVKYDYNIDLKINSIDVSMFIGGWIKNDKDSIAKFDSSNDGVINTLDYSLLVKNLDR